jgi:hypothetical protein
MELYEKIITRTGLLYCDFKVTMFDKGYSLKAAAKSMVRYSVAFKLQWVIEG